MTTNCNDTCDAVDKLLLSEISWKQTDMWGSFPSLTRPLPSLSIPARLYVFKLPERQTCLERSCLSTHGDPAWLKESGPQTLPLARCHSVLQSLCSVCPASLEFGWLSKGCRLTSSRFLLKLTNVYDNTNELSSVQKCAFQIPQRFFVR